MRSLSAFLGVILSAALVTSASKAWAQCQDNDNDGFCSVASGGNDCADVMSAFKESSTGICRESLQPIYLAPPAIPAGLPQSDPWIFDHSWISDGSGYHLFAHGINATGGSIRHFVSPDLSALLLPANPANSIAITSTESWEADGLWAPHVIKYGDTYYMYYTGVILGPLKKVGGGDDVFKIGLATSTDLMTWTKQTNPVYDCSAPWVATTGDNAHHCRDPFVIRDEAHNRWLLFATDSLNTQETPGPDSEGVVVAQSPNVSGPWTSLGYIMATKTLPVGIGVGAQLTPPFPRQGIAENPFVTYFNGRYYLFFKDFKDADCDDPANIMSEIQYATSETLTADSFGSANWTYRGYIPDPGMSAAEIIDHEGDTWIMSATVANCYADSSVLDCAAGCPIGFHPPHENELRLKRIVWDDRGGFTTKNLTRLNCRVASDAIHPFANDPCNDGVDQDCNPCTSACSGGGGHQEPTE